MRSEILPASGLPVVREPGLAVVPSSAPALPPETITLERHLDLARGDVWLDDLARDIAAAADRGGRLRFVLASETLGRLDVEVRRGDAGVSIHMAARSDTARDVLTAAQPRLIDDIRSQGVRVTATEVSPDTAGFGSDRSSGGPQTFAPPAIETAQLSPETALPNSPETAAEGRYA